MDNYIRKDKKPKRIYFKKFLLNYRIELTQIYKINPIKKWMTKVYHLVYKNWGCCKEVFYIKLLRIVSVVFKDIYLFNQDIM